MVNEQLSKKFWQFKIRGLGQRDSPCVQLLRHNCRKRYTVTALQLKIAAYNRGIVSYMMVLIIASTFLDMISAHRSKHYIISDEW